VWLQFDCLLKHWFHCPYMDAHMYPLHSEPAACACALFSSGERSGSFDRWITLLRVARARVSWHTRYFLDTAIPHG
jgi:hypothetical protein